MEKLVLYDFWIAHFLAGVLYTMGVCSMMGSLAGIVGEKILIHQKRPPLGTFKYELIDSLIWTFLFAFLFLAITWKNPEGSSLRQLKMVVALQNSKGFQSLVDSTAVRTCCTMLLILLVANLVWDCIFPRKHLSFYYHEVVISYCFICSIFIFSLKIDSCLWLIFTAIIWLVMANKHMGQILATPKKKNTETEAS